MQHVLACVRACVRACACERAVGHGCTLIFPHLAAGDPGNKDLTDKPATPIEVISRVAKSAQAHKCAELCDEDLQKLHKSAQ
jgi:hypothetical protein